MGNFVWKFIGHGSVLGVKKYFVSEGINHDSSDPHLEKNTISVFKMNRQSTIVMKPRNK